MQFQYTQWNSIEDLFNKIKAVADATMSAEFTDNPLEIERKWLVDYSLIDYFKNNPKAKKIRHLTNLQGYLSVNPEIRYRSALDVDTRIAYHYIAYKSDGDLVREEYEYEVTTATALKLAKVIRDDNNIRKINDSKFIHKDYYVFSLGSEIEFEISIVDNNKNFTYMEIEFPNIEAANNFKIPEEINRFIKREVTDDPSYKMKNYWVRTRLKK